MNLNIGQVRPTPNKKGNAGREKQKQKNKGKPEEASFWEVMETRYALRPRQDGFVRSAPVFTGGEDAG